MSAQAIWRFPRPTWSLGGRRYPFTQTLFLEAAANTHGYLGTEAFQIIHLIFALDVTGVAVVGQVGGFTEQGQVVCDVVADAGIQLAVVVYPGRAAQASGSTRNLLRQL